MCLEYFRQTFAPMLGVMLSDQCILSKQSGCDITFTLFRIDERTINLLCQCKIHRRLISNLIFLFYVSFYHICLFSKIIIRRKCCKMLVKAEIIEIIFLLKKKKILLFTSLTISFLIHKITFIIFHNFSSYYHSLLFARSCMNLIERNSK